MQAAAQDIHNAQQAGGANPGAGAPNPGASQQNQGPEDVDFEEVK